MPLAAKEIYSWLPGTLPIRVTLSGLHECPTVHILCPHPQKDTLLLMVTSALMHCSRRFLTHNDGYLVSCGLSEKHTECMSEVIQKSDDPVLPFWNFAHT